MERWQQIEEIFHEELQRDLAQRDEVVLISAGAVETNHNQQFPSTIVLDQRFSAGKAFGATGRPSARLLDEDARVVSKTVVRKHDILKFVFGAALRPL